MKEVSGFVFMILPVPRFHVFRPVYLLFARENVI